MREYEDCLRRGGSRRLGFGKKPDGEIHPLHSLAIIYGVLLGLALLVS